MIIATVPRDCPSCLYRREDMRDGGYCYMFKEIPGATCPQFYPLVELKRQVTPSSTPAPVTDPVTRIIGNAMAVVAHWKEFGPANGFEEDIACLESRLNDYRKSQNSEAATRAGGKGEGS